MSGEQNKEDWRDDMNTDVFTFFFILVHEKKTLFLLTD